LFVCNVSALLSKNSSNPSSHLIAWDATSKAYLITLGPDHWARKVSSDSARFLPTDNSLTQTELGSPMEKRIAVFLQKILTMAHSAFHYKATICFSVRFYIC